MLPLITLFTGKKKNGLPSGLPARGANLSHAKLAGLNLSGESLPQADLNEAKLTGTNLSNCDLTQAYFTHADCRNANFSGAKLERAVFRATDLTGAIFSNANLRHAIFDDRTKLPFSREEAERLGMICDNEITGLP